jgi:Protein of unknown function (DUF3147)
MLVKLDPSKVKETRWHEFGVRFLLGGLITAFAGIIGHKYGAPMGGLFLAFPAIFPASATLIDKHEKEKKERAGLNGHGRARQLVSVDAAGTAIGSIGLFVFAFLIHETIRDHSTLLVIGGATIVWAGVSVLAWYLRKRTRSSCKRAWFAHLHGHR